MPFFVGERLNWICKNPEILAMLGFTRPSNLTSSSRQIVWHNPNGDNRDIAHGSDPDPVFDHRSVTVDLSGVTVSVVVAVTLEDDAFFFVFVNADTEERITIELLYRAEDVEYVFDVNVEPTLGTAFEDGTLGLGVDFFDKNGNGVYDYDVNDPDRFNDYPLFAIASIVHDGDRWTNPHR